jgi:pyrroloquinoline quinone biosynthesis protein B
MRHTIAAAALLLAVAAQVFAASPYVVVLGIAQDAGIPQMGCETPFCRAARKDATLRQTVASIALVDPDSKSRWIFDATPDLPEQFDLLKEVTGDRTNHLTGIFLTHAHIGHYTGLMYLGREAMNTNSVTVYAMPRMKLLLETNAPWSQLVSIKNIAIRPLSDKTPVAVNNRITVEPFLVPHRDEFSETVGYRIKTASKTLVFIPDIDKWQKWATALPDVVKTADYLLIDGTFYADGEIARPMSEVPHPFVTETMTLLNDLPAKERAKVFFIHFNHSNPLVQGNKAKLSDVKKLGFSVSHTGQRFEL